MKGIILAAGKGSRLAELNLQHKSFAVVNKKHVIDYSLDLLANEGGEPLVSEIVIVVGFHAESVMAYVGDSYKGVPVRYVEQAERRGIAHAVKTAAAALADDFIMCLADEILFNPRLEAMVRAFRAEPLDVMCGVILDGTDFSMKPIAYETDAQGYLTGVTEKPAAYTNDYRGIGECVFSKKALDYLETLQPNALRGEYEMGDWIRSVIEDGRRARVFDLADGYANINYTRDIASAEERMQKSSEP